jgi:hypothetical protein
MDTQVSSGLGFGALYMPMYTFMGRARVRLMDLDLDLVLVSSPKPAPFPSLVPLADIFNYLSCQNKLLQ